MIKKILYQFLLIVAASYISVAGVWTNAQHTKNSVGPTSFTDISIVNKSIVWIGGLNGAVGRSTNGGETYGNVSTNSSDNIYVVCGVNADTALVATYSVNGAYIYRTSNGGVSWDSVYSNPLSFINSVHMFDGANGFAQGDPVGGFWTLLKTSDGGQTWTDATTLAQDNGEFGFAKSMSWIGDQNAWFGTNNSRIYFTTDGGSNWGWGNTPFFVQSSSIAFATSQSGLAGHEGGGIFQSNNGGETWSLLSNLSPADIVTGMAAAADPFPLWVVVAGHYIHFSDTYGANWNKIGPFSELLNDVDMISIPEDGRFLIIVVTDGGSFIRLTWDIPLLTSPFAAAVDQPLNPTLIWDNFPDALSYNLQIATEYDFSPGSIVVDDSAVSGTTKQIGPLSPNSEYFWRVNVNLATYTSVYSRIRSFRTVSQVQVSKTIPFPSEPVSTDYKLFSMPGITSIQVSDILPGAQKTEWRMFRDNGDLTDFLVDLPSSSQIKNGEGYWLIKRGNLSISRLMTMPSLNTDKTFTVAVHESGWNIIGNPFDKDVQWAQILAANPSLGSAPLWKYDSAYSQSDTVVRFKGYYVNIPVGVTSLVFPYPFPPGTPAPVTHTVKNTNTMDWKLQLITKSDINTDSENYIGTSPQANDQLDGMDLQKPPLVFDQSFLYFVRPEWDRKFSKFCTDIRKSIGEGQIWEFEVTNPTRSKNTISLKGIESVPIEYDVMLINNYNNKPVNLRLQQEYEYQTVSDKMPFKIIIGKKSFIENETAKIVPESFQLAQNFPNPFNPSTSISFSIPYETDYKIDIISLLGQEVKVLSEGHVVPATYTVSWDGTDQYNHQVSTGMYFYRLIANGNVIQTKKMILTK